MLLEERIFYFTETVPGQRAFSKLKMDVGIRILSYHGQDPHPPSDSCGLHSGC